MAVTLNKIKSRLVNIKEDVDKLMEDAQEELETRTEEDEGEEFETLTDAVKQIELMAEHCNNSIEILGGDV